MQDNIKTGDDIRTENHKIHMAYGGKNEHISVNEQGSYSG